MKKIEPRFLYLVQIFGFYFVVSQERNVWLALVPLYGQSSRENNLCLLQAAPHGSHRRTAAHWLIHFYFSMVPRFCHLMNVNQVPYQLSLRKRRSILNPNVKGSMVFEKNVKKKTFRVLLIDQTKLVMV